MGKTIVIKGVERQNGNLRLNTHKAYLADEYYPEVDGESIIIKARIIGTIVAVYGVRDFALETHET